MIKAGSNDKNVYLGSKEAYFCKKSNNHGFIEVEIIISSCETQNLKKLDMSICSHNWNFHKYGHHSIKCKWEGINWKGMSLK
jgi:hypothetical protein